ncbi:MAG: CHASE2 domain-containing protein [Bdellovibrionaceae bacterium]|nr:CHASE2 domain-containing protein [Bdellovibrio sp.]
MNNTNSSARPTASKDGKPRPPASKDDLNASAHFSLRQVITRIIFALIASAMISTLKLDYIESYLYDVRVTLKAMLGLSNPTNTPIVMVKISNATVDQFKGFPGFQQHTNFLNQLKKGSPHFVIYEFRNKDGKIEDIDGTEAERLAFAKTAEQIKEFYVPTDKTELKAEAGKLKFDEPLENIKIFSGPKAPDMYLFAKDSVYRRMLINYQDQILLHANVAGFYNPEIAALKNIRGRFEFLDSSQVYIHYYKQGSFPTFNFEDVLEGKVDPAVFKDRLVIVGTDTGKSVREYVQTPYSREITSMASMELHANMFQTLIDNSAPLRLPPWVNILLTSLISVLTVHVVLTLKPSRGLLLLMATLLGLALVAIILYALFTIWIDLAHPFLAIFLCYYFFIPYRLIIENRKSWEYFQKNKLLKQVEELKTNFISMMSHDLKTPIARIQGMTEMILKDEVALSSLQREAVDTIRSSSDDLLKFINSILQYGRIESQGVELHRQSKDINQIIIDVIKKHEFLAKVKKIKIVKELETLFPVSVDPDLIRQAFSNLIENAIKYSGEESTVIVRTREEQNKVLIDVIDQGIGIPAVDLPNIFMKFFRSHNVKTSTIKGTGLGLYLAQYFVHLHRGEITVISNSDQGSHFTVHLPINQ